MVQVLIVDDDIALRRALGRMVRSAGYEAIEAGSVDEAVAALEGEEIDVALVDLRLGDQSGLELFERIKAGKGHTSGVLISAYLTPDDHAKATDLGAVCALGKPLEDKTLFAAIDEALEQSTGFPGSVHGLSLLDGMQIFHYTGRLVAIHLAGDPPGLIVMRAGDIVHAKVGEEVGMEALSRLMQRASAVVRTTVHVEPYEPTIDQPFEPLLVEVMRQYDEAQPRRRVSIAPPGQPATTGGELAEIGATVHRIASRHLERAWVALADVGGPWAAVEDAGAPGDSAEFSARAEHDELVPEAEAIPEGWRWIERLTPDEGWALLPIPRGKRALGVGVEVAAGLVAHRFRATLLRLQAEVAERWPSEPAGGVTERHYAETGDPELLATLGDLDEALAMRVVDLERGEVLAAKWRADLSDELWALARKALPPEGEASVGFDGGFIFGVAFDQGRRALMAAVPCHLSLGSFRSLFRSRVLVPLEREPA